MKTIKNLFGKKETKTTKKTVNGIFGQLDYSVMKMIKGGDHTEDEVQWPPDGN